MHLGEILGAFLIWRISGGKEQTKIE